MAASLANAVISEPEKPKARVLVSLSNAASHLVRSYHLLTQPTP